MKRDIRCFLLALTLCAAPHLAMAQDPAAIAAALPGEVSEVVTGGSWTDGDQKGVYRAMVILPGGGAPAGVFVQLISLPDETAVPKVAKSIALKEVADGQFSNAFLAMDAETENEMTLIVTAFGSGKEQDIGINFKFDNKGAYEVVPAATDPADAGSGETPKK